MDRDSICSFLDRIISIRALQEFPPSAAIAFIFLLKKAIRNTLEKEWQPVFNPRGLVGYEGRLGVEMRVLQLPSGQDPDDVIRDNPDRWAELVQEAVPVVDFYVRLLTEDIDLEDTKAKARVVDKLLPVLEAVANPVEREDYVQKIARALRLDERAVLARMTKLEREGVERYRGPGGRGAEAYPEDGGVEERPDAVLEQYCLSTLLRRPGLLTQADAVLREKGLDPVLARDFEQTSMRAIFEAWRELLLTRPSVSIEALKASLPRDVQGHLEQLTVDDDVPLADDQLVRDVVVTLLRLRMRRLNAFVQHLRLLMLEAHEEGDARGKQYDQAHLAYAQKLLLTQRALAQSRELGTAFEAASQAMR
jgi:DNA primase